MSTEIMETLKSPNSTNNYDSSKLEESPRQFVQVRQIPSLVPSLYVDGSSMDGSEPDGGSAVFTSGDTPNGPLQSSFTNTSSIRSSSDTTSGQQSSSPKKNKTNSNSNRMTRTGITSVPENAVPPVDQLTRMLPSRQRNRNRRASTTVTRQISLAQLDTSEPEPSEPAMQMTLSATTTTTTATATTTKNNNSTMKSIRDSMQSIRGSRDPRASTVPQKGRKERYSRVKRRKKQDAHINFQGWSRIPSSRNMIGSGANNAAETNHGLSRNNDRNNTPRSNNTTRATNSNSHVTIHGWSRIETPPKASNRKTANNENEAASEARIYSVNMATGEMIGAEDYSAGLYPAYPNTPSGRSTSSRSISMSSLRDTAGKDYGDLGMSGRSEATTIDTSERSASARSVNIGRGRQNYISSAHTRNSHSPTMSPIEGSYSYTIPQHQQQLHLRQQQLRNSNMTSPLILSPMKSVSQRAYSTIKEVSAEEEQGNSNTPLRYRIRPSISSKDNDHDGHDTTDSSIDTTDDKIISTEEATTTKEAPRTIDAIRLPVDYGPDDDGPEIFEDSPRVRPKGNNNMGMDRAASERTTSSTPRPIQSGDRALSYSYTGDANAGLSAQSHYLAAGDSRFRSSTAPLSSVQPTLSDDTGSVGSVEKPGAVAVSPAGKQSIYDKYRAKGMFTQLDSSEARLETAPSLSCDSSIDISNRGQFQDVEGQQPMTANVATHTAPRAPTARVSTAERQQQPIPASVVRRGSTARVSATGIVSVVAANSSDDDDVHEGVPRRSLAPVANIDMNGDKHRSSTKKYGLICIVVFLVLVGGVSGAAWYFSSDAAADKALPTPQTEPPTIPISSAPTSAPRDLGRLEDMLDALLTISTRETMTDSSSAQNKALEWLSFSDPAKLDPTDDNIADRYLLALFYYATEGGSWFASDDYLSGRSVCDWKGTTCSPSSGNSTKEDVISIELERNNLAGSIPDEISIFTSLQRLYLGGNQIQGSIPPSIGNCTNLFELGLAGNLVEGEIPASIGLLTNLVEIGMENNRLSGGLPASIGRLTALSFLSLSRNDITGTLPKDIGNLDKLEALIMQSCKVEELPSEMRQLTRLKQLDFGDNLLFGDLPSFISSMTNLVELKLDFNQLSGAIPTFIGDLLDLELLWLSETDISGEIPAEVVNLPKINDLQLHQTRLEGELLESTFCGQNKTLPSTLTADCGGVNPSVQCSCCTTCY